MTRAVAKWAAVTGLSVSAACAGALTPRGIALDLGSYLDLIRDAPLSIRCQAVRDAEERCARAGFPADCAWSNDVDADHDGWTIAQCKSRPPP